MAGPAFAELGAKSNFSVLDGASHPPEMAAQAAALGQVGLGMCDTNTLAGAVQAHVAAKELGLLGRADDVKWPEPGSRRVTMPGTRDF